MRDWERLPGLLFISFPHLLCANTKFAEYSHQKTVEMIIIRRHWWGINPHIISFPKYRCLSSHYSFVFLMVVVFSCNFLWDQLFICVIPWVHFVPPICLIRISFTFALKISPYGLPRTLNGANCDCVWYRKDFSSSHVLLDAWYQKVCVNIWKVILVCKQKLIIKKKTEIRAFWFVCICINWKIILLQF